MSRWKVVGSVVAGTVVTVVVTAATLVLLPLVGYMAAEAGGSRLSLWAFVVPLVTGASLGGAITGYLRGDTSRKSAILGSIAAACGLSAVGAVVGLVFLLLMLGMTPAHGQETDLSKAAVAMGAVGGGIGLVSGAVFGALGGVGGHVYRRKYGF